jgi:AraC-like DNA-binding protein
MYAKQLIESGETASGAAYKVGFGDYSAFYRAYVRIIGKAPTQDGEIKTDV